jgi:beta-glucanase (GH16 family)
MSFFGPNAQRRYPGSQTSPSATNLLQPSPKPQSSHNSLTPYGVNVSRSPSVAHSISDKYSLSPDPTAWGSNLSPDFPEADDYLHNPDPRRDRKLDHGGNIFTYRGFTNLGFLILLCLGLLALFAGYPLISHFRTKTQSTLGGFNLGGTNATGQVPSMSGNWGLIDLETPQNVYSMPSYYDASTEMQLIFSDEFNTDGRTFYPGDDPYWEAVDLHYWETNNLEWYDPAAIITANGSLEITLSAKQTHGLNYQGGLMATWNKFCFTGGLVQASVSLPGANNIAGLWPAIWTMGNLGRAGYGASLDGLWPYSYDSCDVGTAPNQTLNGLPLAATVNGDPTENGVLSFLPGQRLSRCTCKGESHPGPVHSDGTYVGRSAPEIDVFEAIVSSGLVSDGTLFGQVSQSSQWAPFNEAYHWLNTSANLVIPNTTETYLNPYVGGAYQQSASALSTSNQGCYELEQGCFATYAYEYKPGFDDAYITWVANAAPTWTLNVAGMAADLAVNISARPIPQEPMYLIMNLGMSENVGTVDLEHLTFPTTMRVDWIRVYQPKDAINIGCDPTDFPTEAYINQYIEAYTNPNLTTWVSDYGQPEPKSSFLGQC